ncbi:hypothetical protein [Halorientalis marina]|uniref:hypothetical protein n=1 Tax=Halorientalis marina TaxID=2931976 RepID=UPI001FF66046|nr:hypothetical protein [Halorientalis marina]
MRLRVAGVITLVLLAGCGASPGGTGPTTTAPADTATAGPGTATTAGPPTADSPATTATAADGTVASAAVATATATPGGERVEVDGDLDANATRVFERIERSTGEEVEPSRVVVRHAVFGGGLGYDDPVKRIFHFTATRPYVDSTRGMTRRAGKVYVHPGDGTPDEVEHTLAHEFVHVVQFRTGMVPWIDTSPPHRDRFQANAMLAEGGAVYVADRYAERYGLNSTGHRERARQRYEAGPTGTRYIYSLYYFGARYAAREIDSPDNLSALYENRPTTSEQVLHDLSPAAEPPRNLTVSYERRGWRVPRTDRMGELFVRVALRDQLPRSVAAPAAAGWGNDEIAVFRNGQVAAVAWTLRWDDPANATAFADAFETYRERRSTAYDFRLVRVDADTTVVFGGDPSFVANATASADDAAVTVTAPPE